MLAYEGINARLFDLFYGDRCDDLAFYRSLAAASGGTVLELGCGSGRLLKAMADSGCALIGLEQSWSMLEIAARRLRELPLEAGATLKLVMGDMRRLPFRPGFSLAISACNTFASLRTRSEQLGVLRTLHRLLWPGGRVAIDFYRPSIPAQGAWVEAREHVKLDPVSGRTVEFKRRYRVDRERGIRQTEWTFTEFDPGGTAASSHSVFIETKLLDLEEMRYLLVLSGFREIEFYHQYHPTSTRDDDTGDWQVVASR